MELERRVRTRNSILLLAHLTIVACLVGPVVGGQVIAVIEPLVLLYR